MLNRKFLTVFVSILVWVVPLFVVEIDGADKKKSWADEVEEEEMEAKVRISTAESSTQNQEKEKETEDSVNKAESAVKSEYKPKSRRTWSDIPHG